jgi:hypothetical protein
MVMTPEQVADLQWLVGMAFSAYPGMYKKGDGKRFDRIQELFNELSNGQYQRVPSRFEQRRRKEVQS